MYLGFEHPFTCLVAGPSKSGKTEFVKKLLRALPLYVYPCPTRVVWASGVQNEEQMREIHDLSVVPVEFIEDIPDLGYFSPDDRSLLIIDDLMVEAGKSKHVAELFTKGSHHKNVSVVLLLQNLFHQAPKMRDIHLNANYIVLTKNPRDMKQIRYLANQSCPQNPDFLVSAYKQCTNRPYGYLLLDFCQTTPDEYRAVTGIFPPERFQKFTYPK
jgi:hypothetical protein